MYQYFCFLRVYIAFPPGKFEVWNYFNWVTRYLYPHELAPFTIHNRVSSWGKWLDEGYRTAVDSSLSSRSPLLDHTRIPDARSSPDNLWLWVPKACAANRCCGLPQEASEDAFLCGRGILQVRFYPFISSHAIDGKEKRKSFAKTRAGDLTAGCWPVSHRAVVKMQSYSQPSDCLRTSILTLQGIH